MGKVPDLRPFAAYTAVSVAVLYLGYGWFTRTKKAFADVL
jgi:hypothetical protein